jgi:membrane carboxypeptidase/penicillin-binding protein
VGGVDTVKGSYNRALFARRQPGSAIKPLIYAAALEQGVTAGSIWDDTPVVYERGIGAPWRPQNYDGKVYGDLSLRQALAYSNNIIAIKLLESIGVPSAVEVAGRMRLPLQNRNDLSLALGTEEVTLHDLVLAYSPLATAGLSPGSRTIIRIYDRTRQVWTENPPAVSQAISPAVAYVLTRMLQDVLVYGTARNLHAFSRERPVAGKTGTTDEYRDAWFVGFTSRIVAGVWVGFDQPKPIGEEAFAAKVALPLWTAFMRRAAAVLPPGEFNAPPGMQAVELCSVSFEIASDRCPRYTERFKAGDIVPQRPCPIHGGSLRERVGRAVGGFLERVRGFFQRR